MGLQSAVPHLAKGKNKHYSIIEHIAFLDSTYVPSLVINTIHWFYNDMCII